MGLGYNYGMFQKFKYFIFSADPDMLVKFYVDVLGMKIVSQLTLPNDYGYMVEVAPGYEIWIARHTEIKGRNLEPLRHMLNIYTDDVVGYFEKVKDVDGVTIIQPPMSMGEIIPGENRLVCTITDPEGNCIQFMGIKS